MARIEKIKAFSLVEVLVGMVIISIISTMCVMVFVNASGFGNNQQRIKILVLTSNIIEESKSSGNYADEDFTEAGLTMEKRILPYKNSGKVKILSVSVKNEKGVELFSRRCLVAIN